MLSNYNITIHDKIYSGSFNNTVYIGRFTHQKNLFVIKHSILKKKDEIPYYNCQKGEHNIELRCMRILSPHHIHIVQFINVIYDIKDSIFILMEYCSGGDLYEYITKNAPHGTSEKFGVECMSYMLIAIQHCHSHRIIHRDIKLENFIFSNVSCLPHQLKLTDFGLSHIDDSDCICKKCKLKIKHKITNNDEPQSILNHACGSLSYAAPEMLRPPHVYTCRVDCWAVGICLYALLTGRRPFDTNKNIVYKIENGLSDCNYNQLQFMNINSNTIDLITNLLCLDASKRYSAKQASNHIKQIKQSKPKPKPKPKRLRFYFFSRYFRAKLYYSIIDFLKSFFPKVFSNMV